VEGTRVELGFKLLRRSERTDWDRVRELAKAGTFDDIPAQVYVAHYRSLKAIASDNMAPAPAEREIRLYWGPTGTGKSRRAWDEAGYDAYCKDPRTKFWDGYRGQANVVMDEFRGAIDVSHLLRWFDRYPVNVELKGSACVFRSTRIWITSNIPPRQWYPLLDEETLNALMRRLIIVNVV